MRNTSPRQSCALGRHRPARPDGPDHYAETPPEQGISLPRHQSVQCYAPCPTSIKSMTMCRPIWPAPPTTNAFIALSSPCFLQSSCEQLNYRRPDTTGRAISAPVSHIRNAGTLRCTDELLRPQPGCAAASATHLLGVDHEKSGGLSAHPRRRRRPARPTFRPRTRTTMR